MRKVIVMVFVVAFLIITFVTFNAALNHPKIELPELITIPNGSFHYQPAGTFYQGNRVVDAPLELREITGMKQIMKYPVSVRNYAICVQAGFCDEVQPSRDQDLPQTGVNYFDAIAYAEWFTNLKGDNWRLPTDEEWVRAASERFRGDNLLINSDDPSERWLTEYEHQYNSRAGVSVELRSLGSYGENSLGLADISGAVWEWTQSCMLNGKVSMNGVTLTDRSEYCGVRIAEGRHRAFIVNFVRDPKVGGCAVGLPPSYLGFRLVRETY